MFCSWNSAEQFPATWESQKIALILPLLLKCRLENRRKKMELQQLQRKKICNKYSIIQCNSSTICKRFPKRCLIISCARPSLGGTIWSCNNCNSCNNGNNCNVKNKKDCLNVAISYEVQDQAWAEQCGVATIATDHHTETHPRCLTDYINHSIRFLHKHQNPLITHSLIS